MGIKPIVAIVGRPNVGKSTLFNRLVGRRISIVEDTPGVTRDRIYADVRWLDHAFTLIDTGGLELFSEDSLYTHMRQQAQLAAESADVILFLLDGQQGLTAEDYDVADYLRRCKKPLVLGVNKVDNSRMDEQVKYDYYCLGLGEPHTISAVQGLGLGDMLDELVSYFPQGDEPEAVDEEAIQIAVVGKPNAGKSSLVNEILYKHLARDLNRARCIPGKHAGIDGIEQLDKVIAIDQSPIGRTPRSNPATYTGVFDMIRDLFASTSDAKAKGYKKGRFSFNVKGGRCEACGGDGIIKIEMHFLPDVYVPCEVCGGKRYNRETLDVKYKGKSIYDVLDMTVEEALTFFENVPSIQRKIQTLYDVGLSYVKLGQPSTELSGGEAQRIKLAAELSRRSTGRTIYILDEPTTGLHFADVHKLTEILHRLSADGNTVVVIEHNLDVIKTADYIIDMGPEGGDKGGTVIAKGTPEEVAESPVSYTGKYIKPMLEK